MTRDDIIRMARDCGWVIYEDMPYMDVQAIQDALIERLERFAALVAAAERDKYEAKFKQLEALMHVREQQPNKPCCLAEREACAKVCASLDETDMRSRYDYRRGVLDCVDAIRARGKQNDL